MNNNLERDLTRKGPKRMRTNTTFKVEITIDLPSCDNNEWLNQRIKESVDMVLHYLNKDDFEGHLSGDDGDFMGHRYEIFYGYDEETDYDENEL